MSKQKMIQDSSVSVVTRLHSGLRNLGLILGRDRNFTFIHIADIGRLTHAIFYQRVPKALSPGVGVKRNRRQVVCRTVWNRPFYLSDRDKLISLHSRSHPIIMSIFQFLRQKQVGLCWFSAYLRWRVRNA